jgi:hypothetical protein
MVYPNVKFEAAEAAGCRLLNDVKVKRYMDFKKSMVRAQSHIDYQQVIDRKKVIAFYEHENTTIDSSEKNTDDYTQEDLNELQSGGVPLTKEAKKFCSDVVNKVVVVKNPRGGEDVVRVKEYKFNHPFTPSHSISCLRDLKGVVEAPNHDNGIYSRNPDIRELWDRFQNQDKGNSITALDMAYQFSKRRYMIPEIVAAQARKEIELMELKDGNVDGEESTSYEELDRRWVQGQLEASKQLENFIPERKATVNKLYKQYGYDVAEKDVDQVIDDSSILDPGDGEE